MDKDTKYANQLTLFNPSIEGEKKIFVVWAWGIWSMSIYGLALLWFRNITVVDFDHVQLHNTSTQFYKVWEITEAIISDVELLKDWEWDKVDVSEMEWFIRSDEKHRIKIDDDYVEWSLYYEDKNWTFYIINNSDLGKSKVEALRDTILQFTGIEITAINWLYEPSQAEWQDLIIVWVDNMAARKEVIETSTPTIWFIEGRMKWEIFYLFPFTAIEKMIYFSKHWLSDDKVSQVLCTEKSTSYNTLAIWSIVTKLAKDMIQWKDYAEEIWVDLFNLYFDLR